MLEDIEDGLKLIDSYPVGKSIGHVDFRARQVDLRDAKKFAVWNGKKFLRTKIGHQPGAPIDEWTKILQFIHDIHKIGHSYLQTTRKLLAERF